MTATETGDYFDEAYRDYRAQNPNRKLDHYLDIVAAGSGDGIKEILDVGCGLGAFLKRAAERFPEWQLSGLDIDPSAVSTVSRDVPGAQVRAGSAEQPAFPSSSMDVITAWDSLEHVESVDRARAAIRSMIRPRGSFYFVVPVYDGITGPLIRRLDKDPTHIHKRSRQSWLDWVSEDFQIVDWHGIYRYLLPAGHYVHVPTRALRNHTSAILVKTLAS